MKIVEPGPVQPMVFQWKDDAGEVRSMVEMIILPDLFGKRPAAYIHKVYTDDEFKGRGLAIGLLNEAIKSAQAKGCYKVFLVCHKDVAGFYKKLYMKKDQVGMVKYL